MEWKEVEPGLKKWYEMYIAETTEQYGEVPNELDELITDFATFLVGD